jgi:hypothetical protein
MGVIRVTAVPCTHCGERTWYDREQEEKRLTSVNLLAHALAPVRGLDAVLGVLGGRCSASHAARVEEGLKAEALRKPGRVKGVDVAPGEIVCVSCGYRTYRTTSDRPV